MEKVNLSRAISVLKDETEIEKFLKDLYTRWEYKTFEERWHIAQLLNEKKMSYRDIHSETGVSVTTINKIAKSLRSRNKGYKRALDRLST